jgi:rRNA maturation endonuclease Nob1
MSDATTVTRPFGRRADQVVVRMRCTGCDVAWTGEPDSGCWVCGDEGVSVNRLLVNARTPDPLEEFDLLR